MLLRAYTRSTGVLQSATRTLLGAQPADGMDADEFGSPALRWGLAANPACRLTSGAMLCAHPELWELTVGPSFRG